MFARPTRQQVLIAAATVARFCADILMGTVLAVYVRDAGGTPFAVSTLFTAYFLGLMVFAPTWGAVADVTRRRRAVLLVTGAMATVAVSPLLAFDGVWPPVGARLVYAVFAAGFAPVMLAVVSDRGGKRGRGRSIGAFNSYRGAGISAGQVGAGALLGLLAPDGVFFAIAALSLVSTVSVVALVDRTGPARWPGTGPLLSEIRSRLLPAAADRVHLSRAGLKWLYVALALRNMTVLGVMSLMPVFLTGPVGVSDPVMGGLLAVNPAAQVAFMYVFGRVADDAGRKPLIVLGMLGSGGFALASAATVVATGPPLRLALAAGAFLLIAASFSAMTTGALAFIGDVAPAERESELMGLRTTAKGVGGVLGPPAFGLVATTADYATAFAAGSVLAFAAGALAWMHLTETRPAATRAVTADD